MKIEFIEFKNLFAYGEKMQRIEFSEKGKMILLKGKSGTGKSAILSLPSLLLYGKIDKIPKTSIANRINKNGYLRGVIEKFGHKYEIIRKFSPNSIEIFKDGENLNSIGIKDAQNYIDTEILDIPYQTFSNLISISMRRFKSFLTIDSTSRKQIIDRIFSLDFINQIVDYIKRDEKKVANSINIDNGSIFSLNQTIQKAKEEYNALQSKSESKEKEKIQENIKKLEELSEKIEKIKKGNEILTKQYDEYREQEKKVAEVLIKLRNEENETINKINLFNSDKCPMCHTSFKTSSFDQLKIKLKSYIEQIREKISYAKNISDKIANDLNNCKQRIDVLSVNYRDINSNINYIMIENKSLESSILNKPEFSSLMNIIDSATEQLNKISKDLEEKNKMIRSYDGLLKIFSVEGIKKEVITSYLPMFNHEIAVNLRKLNFPYQLEFDGTFEPTLSDLGEKISVETLSDGEMTRVDMVVLCSLVKILKRKYTSFNIFSIDELISYLDVENGEILLRFLRDFAESMNLNIYVVSHVDISNEVFNESLEIVKEKGFSDIIFSSMS